MSYDPYSVALPAPEIALLSPDFTHGGALPRYAYAAAAGGHDESPAVHWGRLPEGTKSVFVTLFDADAPIPGGFWHWAVAGIPATEPGLPRGAAGSAFLPGSAVQLANSMGAEGFAGAAPPPGTGTHHLYLAVTALSTPSLDLPASAGLALVHAMIIPHTLGRGVLVATADAPA